MKRRPTLPRPSDREVECPACEGKAIEHTEADTGDDSAGGVIVSITCGCGHSSADYRNVGEFCGGDE